MAWTSLKLFSLKGKLLEPDAIMRRLEEFRFDGDEGIRKFEVWDEFNELRLEYLFRVSKYVRIATLDGDHIHEEKMKVESLEPVEVHIKPSGLVEAYGAPSRVRKAVDVLSALGEVSPVVFTQGDFRKVMEMAEDINRVRVFETGDENVMEVALFGGGLVSSRELKRYLDEGKVRRLSGKLELPGDRYSFAMDENGLRFYLKDPSAAQKDVEYFIDSLLS
jgi:hypothetical protein